MSERTVSDKTSGPDSWTNTFPQKPHRSDYFFPGFFGVFSLALLTVPAMPPDPPSWSLIAANVLAALAMGGLGLACAFASLLDGLGTNSTRYLDSHGCLVRTRFFTEPLVHVAFVMLTLGGSCLVFWLWDPYSYLPWGSGSKQALTPFYFAGGTLVAVLIIASRPWRRRLVFRTDALEYRRFGRPITIPWDTIDSLTPENEGFAKTVTVRMRPPGQAPTLDRKHFPDGTSQGKLAIHSMTVDPGTIYNALDRLWKEPEARRLLTTPEGAQRLFTGPSWRERIRMDADQTWAPPVESA